MSSRRLTAEPGQTLGHLKPLDMVGPAQSEQLSSPAGVVDAIASEADQDADLF